MTKLLCAGAFAAACALAGGAHAVSVDVELQLLVDASGSISDSEFSLQTDGYESSFRSSEVQDAIAAGALGNIAAQLIFFSSASEQAIGVDWFLIDSADSANAFADAIAGTDRPFFGLTAIGNALDFGRPLFDDNGFEGTSLVQDVSGDGVNTAGIDPAVARDLSLADGIEINALAVGDAALVSFFESSVIGGPDAFVEQADDFDGFEAAITQKLVAEISDPGGPTLPPVSAVPIPAPFAMLLAAIGILPLVRSRRSAAA